MSDDNKPEPEKEQSPPGTEWPDPLRVTDSWPKPNVVTNSKDRQEKPE